MGSLAKMENTATIMTAALVTTPALLEMPPTSASLVLAPPQRSSRIRLRMNVQRAGGRSGQGPRDRCLCAGNSPGPAICWPTT